MIHLYLLPRNNPSKLTHQFAQSKLCGRANPTQPMTMIHLVLLELPLSLTVEVTLMLESHAEFRYALTSLHTNQIVAIADTRAKTCSSRSRDFQMARQISHADQLQDTRHKIYSLHTSSLAQWKCTKPYLYQTHLDFTYLSQAWKFLNYYLPTFQPQCHGKIWWQAPIQRSSVGSIKEWTSHQSQPLSYFSQQKTLEQWIQ